jgi:hypothetical protein
MKLFLGITALMIFTATSAMAGECALKIKRTACPGKEAEAFKPYMGKVETTEKKDAADEKSCSEIADKASQIVRKGTLSAKDVTATFDGKDLGKTFSGKSECN